MSADPEQEYFADGLAEELLNLLASIPELRVTARTSSFAFRDKQVDVRTIAEQLDVQHILEGSVRKAGDTLRVTAQLIEADSGSHLWSRRFDRKLEDVFAIQDEIAAAVVDALKISLLDEMPEVKQINPDAYALYLQGTYFADRWTEEGFEKAVDAFKAALKLEPEYAPAWAALAETYSEQASHMHRDVNEGTALARAAIERAIALDDSFVQAHTVMVWIKMSEWDWQGANEAMQRAVALDPKSVYTLGAASVLASIMGRLDEAIELGQQAIELSPLELAFHFNHGVHLTAAGRLDEAATKYRHVLELNPQAPYAHYFLGVTSLLQDQPLIALAEMKLEIDTILQDHGIGLALSALGRNAEADQALAAFIEEHEESAAYLIAAAYAYRGDTDQAFMWLDTAYKQRESLLSEILSDPLLTSLKSDPRWSELVDKMGLPT
jgi:TolB-like protein